MIHVRFAPNGEVTEIGERPAGTTAQGWFNRLSQHSGNGYQPLSGAGQYSESTGTKSIH
jgi:hypothetical protein